MSNIVKSIGNAISGVVKGVVKVVTGVVKAVVDVVSSVINFVAQPFLSIFDMPSMPTGDQAAAREQGVTLTQSGSNVHIPVVYGFRQVGGTITYAETGSDNNQYLWVAYALSEGPVEGLYDIYIDDHKLKGETVRKLNNGQTVDIDYGKYKGRVKLQFSHGNYFATPSSSPVGGWSILSEAPSWKTTMVYNGVSVLFARYEWKKIETQDDADNNPFSGSIPAIKVGMLGKKVHKITASTGSTAYDSETEEYSTNPADILLDYMRNPRYGKGLANDDIDFASWLVAKNKCATTVTYVNGITGPILTCNYVLDTGQTLFNNTKTLLSGFRGYMPFIQGKYKLKIEDAGNPTDITSGSATIVATFNEDNIQGPVTFSAVDRTSKYNVVQVTYVNPDKKFSTDTVIFPETDAERQTYINIDGRENKLDAAFTTITNFAIAKDMARLMFNKSRFQESCSLTVSSQGLELEVGDCIRIQSFKLNFGTTVWRIVSMRINNDMTVDLGCVRNDDSLYPYTTVGEEDIVLPPYVPVGATIEYPTDLSLSPPIGLVPPTGGGSVVLHTPPTIRSITPFITDSAGYTTVTVSGLNFVSGITAQWIGNDGTIYTPDSAGGSQVVFVSSTELTFETITAMDENNSPYDLKIINPASAGSLSARINNCLAIEETVAQPTPDPDPPIQDPPVIEDPPDDDVTPPVTDPPPEGPGDNDDPVDPPAPVVTFDDFVEFIEVKYTVEGDLVYATIKGVQPNRADYKELLIYYKRNIASETVYQQMTVTTKPGANQQFTFRLGPLLKGRTPYQVISRVKYSTNELSTRVNKIILNTSGAVTIEDPRDYVEQASTGWPADPGEQVTATNNKISVINAQTLLTGGNPRDPKELQVSITQDINNQPVNWRVNGVNFYYRSSAGSAWTKGTYLFSGNYVPGTTQTFTLDADIGSPSYPSIPTSVQQKYDFVFRLRYDTGQESSEQIRIIGARTEYSGTGLYDFDPFTEVLNIREKATDFDLEVADPSAPSAASSMTIALNQITSTLSGNKAIRFYVKPPEASVLADWRGVNIRYRKVILGADPDFETFTSTSTGISSLSGLQLIELEIDFDQQYEFVLTPLYANSGARSDSTESLFGTGYVHRAQTRDDYPSTGNWLQSFNFVDMKTSLALKTIDAAFPAPPTPIVDIVEWKLLSVKNNFYINHYYKLTFDHRAISGFTQLNIYRRTYDPAAASFSITAQANFYGVGRWEKIDITSVNASANTTVFLRPPLHFQEYNYNYVIGGSLNLRNGFAENNINGAGPLGTDQFLVVAVDGSGEATEGWLLTGGRMNSGLDSQRDLLLGFRPQQVELSTFNPYNTALEKNLNQAITAITIANTKYNYRSDYSNIAASTTPALE